MYMIDIGMQLKRVVELGLVEYKNGISVLIGILIRNTSKSVYCCDDD